MARTYIFALFLMLNLLTISKATPLSLRGEAEAIHTLESKSSHITSINNMDCFAIARNDMLDSTNQTHNASNNADCFIANAPYNDKEEKTTDKKITWQNIKSYFFGAEERKKRKEAAEKSYEYYMKLLEHEGMYFIYSYNFLPYGINDRSEIQFQISAKVPLWRGALWSKGTIFFGYTQVTWFQNLNFKYSNPIRDTDYKPSIFYSYPANWKLFGGAIKDLRIGMLHYSNGVGGIECQRDPNVSVTPPQCRSRSASNRIMFEAIWEHSGFGIHLSAWPYINKRRDNLDLPDYMGYADLRLYYKYKRHFAEMHIQPIVSDYTKYHGSIKLGYAFALNRYISIYGQYFYGYGDSLYEYNRISHRMGIGMRARAY